MEVLGKRSKKPMFIFQGIPYYIGDGYYRNYQGQLLHRVIWSHHYGEIPKGMNIHHIDHNPLNNDINNLVMMTLSEHRSHHFHESVSKGNKKILAFIEDAKARNKSLAGTLRQKSPAICSWCGKTYEADLQHIRLNLCSNSCRKKSYRASGMDSCTYACVICGTDFIASKCKVTKTCGPACLSQLRKQIAGLKKAINSIEQLV